VKQYYIAISGQSPVIMTSEQIQTQLGRGIATPESLVVAVGGSQWIPLRQAFPDWFPPPLLPLPEHNHPARQAVTPAPASNLLPAGERFMTNTAETLGHAGRVVSRNGAKLARAVHAFGTRIVASNFTKADASEKERHELEHAAVPVRSVMSQNYAAWRRAMLWFASVGLVFTGFSSIVDFFQELSSETLIGGDVSAEFTQQVGKANADIINHTLRIPGIILFLDACTALIAVLAPVFVILAALKWSDVQKSRRLAWLGWLCVFIVPFLVLLFPIPALVNDNFGIHGSFFKMDGFSVDMAPLKRGLWSGVGIIFAIVTLAPHVLSVFPGILRACVTLRTLIPESPFPAWVCMVVAPLYAMLFGIIVVLALQSNHLVLAIGLGFILALPMLTLKNIRKLSQPATAEEMNDHLTAFKRKQTILQWVGVTLCLVGISSYYSQIGPWKMISTGIQLLANIFFMTVVASDFILGLMHLAHMQAKTLHRSPLYSELDRRFQDLDQVQLTEFDEPSDSLPAVEEAA
jgi:hypothetical protein